VDGDGTGSFLSFGCRFSEGDRRPHIADGQLQRLRYPAASIKTDAEETSIPITAETQIK